MTKPEFNLTFPEALTEAEKGKVISCNSFGRFYMLEYGLCHEGTADYTELPFASLMKEKWALIKVPEIYTVECVWDLSSFLVVPYGENLRDKLKPLIGKKTKLTIEVLDD